MDVVLRPARLLLGALLVATASALLVVGGTSAPPTHGSALDDRPSSSPVSVAAGEPAGPDEVHHDLAGASGGQDRDDHSDDLASGLSIAPAAPVVADLRATILPRDPWFSGRTGFIDTRHSSQHHTRPGTSPG